MRARMEKLDPARDSLKSATCEMTYSDPKNKIACYPKSEIFTITSGQFDHTNKPNGANSIAK